MQESTGSRAVAAVEYFEYGMTKYDGAYAAVFGGLDAFVFTAGIGEHSAPVRAALCAKLAWLGVKLDRQANDFERATYFHRGQSRIRVGHSDGRGTDDRAAHVGARSPIEEASDHRTLESGAMRSIATLQLELRRRLEAYGEGQCSRSS